ncbi:NAD(P)H-binding protein [Streptomyces sp. ACA25]|uniref:NmrA family NAD(P)-binding protein n=1 Tax=Streptomyces sp. ACA25 TaxID=3022596 RepID=UPI002306EEA9|nr:NAD(P)H-binding protein [Streptomyces sp. ACA25]MDB1089054.1 NAD(P)H-binding protein [Streptomyces sp. ACA25]
MTSGQETPVLVTGAAGGRQGATGMHVTRLLLDTGHAVRALVRTEDARADALRALGAEVVVGDLREIASVLPALRGVRRAFFTYPVTNGLLEATGAFAAAARREGLERVVEVSQLAADPDAGTPRMRQHWVAEQVFDWAGVGAVHLRAAVFFENLDFLVRAGGGTELALPLGSPQTVLPLVAGTDVARVAAGLLTAALPPPDPVVRLTGQVLAVGEAAGRFGRADGRRVVYTDVPPGDWRQRAMRLFGDPHTVAHLSALWEVFRAIGAHHELYEVTEVIGRVGGRPPQTLEAYVRGTGVPGSPQRTDSGPQGP